MCMFIHIRANRSLSNAAGEPIWDPGVFTIIIIFFPYWWLSYNKLFYLSVEYLPRVSMENSIVCVVHVSIYMCVCTCMFIHIRAKRSLSNIYICHLQELCCSLLQCVAVCCSVLQCVEYLYMSPAGTAVNLECVNRRSRSRLRELRLPDFQQSFCPNHGSPRWVGPTNYIPNKEIDNFPNTDVDNYFKSELRALSQSSEL